MSPFWQTIPLAEMSREQWESLCDGCAKCCMQKLEDTDTREIIYTNVVCRLLDLDTCLCMDYFNRSRCVPTCVTLGMDDLKDPYWLPSTCTYRLLAESKPLPDWHPLVRGDPNSTFIAGESVHGKVVPETEVDDLELHMINWVTA